MIDSVPNKFVAGTKASAEQVNENFDHVVDLIRNINPNDYGAAFCVNTGQVNEATGKADILYHNGNEVFVRTKTVNSTDEFQATTAQGKVLAGMGSDVFVDDVVSTMYDSIIPTFESSVNANASVSATSEDENHPVWQAFDKNEDSNWSSFTGVDHAELILSLKERHIVSYYKIKMLIPCSWTLYGSNDQESWTELDSFHTTQATMLLRKLPVLYNYDTYKLVVQANSGYYQVRVAELDLFEESLSGSVHFPETLYVYLKDAEHAAARPGNILRQVVRPLSIGLYNSVILPMTANILPEPYEISASSEVEGHPAFHAADNKKDTYWEAEENGSAWIQVYLPTRVVAKWLKLTAADSTKAPVSGVLLASNNGLTWTEIASFSGLNWTHSGEEKYIGIRGSNQAYSYYRLSADFPFASLAEIQLYSAEANGEYCLGEARPNDVWFKLSAPYSAIAYKGYGSTITAEEEFSGIPVGEMDLDADGNVTRIESYPFNQNGTNINSFTTEQFSGNLVTKDQFDARFSQTGYTQLPNGLIFQWGVSKKSDTTLFPLTFSKEVFKIFINGSISSQNISGFTTDVEENWFAIGW